MDSKYGYNLKEAGRTGKDSDVTRKRKSEAVSNYYKNHKHSHLGIPRDKDTKFKISQSHIGIKLSPEHVESIRLSKTGVKQSDETKLRNSISQKLAIKEGRRVVNIRYMIEATSKPVNQYDKDMNLMASFKSIQEAQRQTGAKHISQVVTGKRKYALNSIWRFKDGQTSNI